MIDRKRGCFAERLCAKAEESEVLLAVANGALAGAQHRRVDVRQLAHVSARAQEEDAAVPEEGAAVDEALRGLPIGLLNKAVDAEHAIEAAQRLAALDVAIARIR